MTLHRRTRSLQIHFKSVEETLRSDLIPVKRSTTNDRFLQLWNTIWDILHVCQNGEPVRT